MNLKDLAEALTLAVTGHLMSMEHAAAIWKDQLTSEGFALKKPVATSPKTADVVTPIEVKS